MRWDLVKIALDYAKAAAVIIAILWGLLGLNRLGTTIDDLGFKIMSIQDQYIGLQLANSDLIKSLNTMTDESAEIRALISKLDELVELQGQAAWDSQQKQQGQIDELIKFLMRTYPEHKAELQSLTAK